MKKIAAILGFTLRWHIKNNFYSRPWLFNNLPVQLADKYLACLGGYALDWGMLWLYGGMTLMKILTTPSDMTFFYIIYLCTTIFKVWPICQIVYNEIDGVGGDAHL